MANHVSAKKRFRQIQRRTQVNTMRLSRIRTYLRIVEEAIVGGDRAKASDALRVVQPELMRGAKHGILHQNMVSRKLSRLSARIKKMAA